MTIANRAKEAGWRAVAFVLAGSAALTAVSASAVQASSVIPMTLQTVADHAGQVIVGEVTAVRSYWTENPRNIESEVTFQNVEYLKGHMPSSTTTFKLLVPGGTVGTMTMRVSDAPDFAVGEKWVLFLLPEYRVFPVVGLWEGAFRVVADEGGAERVYDADHAPVLGLDVEGFVQVAAKSKPDAQAHLVAANNIRLVKPAAAEPVNGGTAQAQATNAAAISMEDFRAMVLPIVASSKVHELSAPAGQPVRGGLKAKPIRLAPAQQAGVGPPAGPPTKAQAPRGVGRVKEVHQAPRQPTRSDDAAQTAVESGKEERR